MTDQQQRGNWYEPDEDGLCANYKLHRECGKCWYQTISFAEGMTAIEYIKYMKQTKGAAGRCNFGHVGRMFACTPDDMRMTRDMAWHVIYIDNDIDENNRWIYARGTGTIMSDITPLQPPDDLL